MASARGALGPARPQPLKTQTSLNLNRPPLLPFPLTRQMASEPSRLPPTAATGRIAKHGSITPSVRNFLNRYPPAIIDDTVPPIPEDQPRRQPPTQVNSFDRRFPSGYAIADSSIPLHPDEVPEGYEKLFSPTYSPICKRVRSPFWVKRGAGVCFYFWADTGVVV